MLSMMSLPMPGQANTVSVTSENASRLPNSRPTTVTTGIRMFFSTCTKMTRLVRQRFARAGAREADHQGDVEQRQVQRRHQHVAQAVQSQQAGAQAEEHADLA